MLFLAIFVSVILYRRTGFSAAFGGKVTITGVVFMWLVTLLSIVGIAVLLMSHNDRGKITIFSASSMFIFATSSMAVLPALYGSNPVVRNIPRNREILSYKWYSIFFIVLTTTLEIGAFYIFFIK